MSVAGKRIPQSDSSVDIAQAAAFTGAHADAATAAYIARIRSESFVARAHTRGADAIILDLEDAIAPGEKVAARALLAAAVPRVRQGGADVVVRVNRALRLAVADIDAAVAAGADALILTKLMGADHVRLLGVLQRLAICSVGAGLAFVWLNTRALAALTVSLLVGYWAMLALVPVPGFGAGDFAEGHNLTNWIDKMYLPFRKWDGDHDPEGLFSTLPAIASSLLGVFAGLVIRNPAIEPVRKVRLLVLWGAAGIAAALLWHLQFPIIKKIWTSSFVLLTAGISSLLLAGFYHIIDVRNHRGWCRPFVWIGMNAITIYLIAHVVSLGGIAKRFVGGEIGKGLEGLHHGLGALAAALLALGFSFLICRFLFERKVFLRV
jgi:predicted acyltransferase